MERHLDTLTTTKRSLAVLCSALETSIATQPRVTDRDQPAVVLGLFQRRGYFEQARHRYERLAASGAVCVVAFGGDVEGLPPGVHGVSLDLTDALSGEWSLVVLDGTFGASLVARDLGDVDPKEATFEAGRLFSANWAFSATRAAAEGRRIVDGLGPRLDRALRDEVLRAVRQAVDCEPSDVERRLTDVTEVLIRGLDVANHRNSRLTEQVRLERENSERDALTGLHNRRYLDRYLASAVDTAPVRVVAVLVDLDGLKDINDTHGHEVGDAALAAVAHALSEVVRPQDVVVRLGGDEFLAVIPGQSSASGLRVAERMVERVNSVRLPEPWDALHISVSAGVSAVEPNRIDLAGLDRALYSAKRQGKGRAYQVSATLG